MPFGNIARAIETDETAGVVKIVLDAKTERLLGVCVVGVDAGEGSSTCSACSCRRAHRRAPSSTASSRIRRSPRACRRRS